MVRFQASCHLDQVARNGLHRPCDKAQLDYWQYHKDPAKFGRNQLANSSQHLRCQEDLPIPQLNLMADVHHDPTCS